MRVAKVISALFLLSAPMLAFADDRGLYVGGGVTQGKVDESQFEDKDNSYKVYAGYRLNNYLAFEGAVVDFGDMREGDKQFDGQSVQANLRLGFPIGQRIRLFGTAGVHGWTADGNMAGESEDMDALYGFGAELDVLGGLGLRMEQETLQVGDIDFDQTTLSAYWRL